MNWLENDNFVSGEVIPIIKEDIQDWIDDNRYEAWFDTAADIDDFAEENLPNELYDKIEADIYDAIEEFGEQYNIENIQYNHQLDETILENLLYENWEYIKRRYIDTLRSGFGYDDYMNDYLDEE